MFFVVVGTNTEHVINEFAFDARINIQIFQCHTVTNGTDLRRSPLGSVKTKEGSFPFLEFLFIQVLETTLMRKAPLRDSVGALHQKYVG